MKPHVVAIYETTPILGSDTFNPSAAGQLINKLAAGCRPWEVRPVCPAGVTAEWVGPTDFSELDK
jgi:hypothetical protein